MESLFVGATLGVLAPFYAYGQLQIIGNAYYLYPTSKQCLLIRMFYRKIKLNFEFDTDNFFITQINIDNYPNDTILKYEVDGEIYKEITQVKYQGCINYSEFRLRVYKKTEEEDVRHWNYYMNNGQIYKFKSLSYEYI